MTRKTLKNIYEYAKFFSMFPFEWFTTFTFNKYYGAEQIYRMRKNWTINLCVSEHLQLAYFWVLVYKDAHPHLHLLAFGLNSQNQGLNIIDKRKWEAAWPFFARIKSIDNVFQDAWYFSKNVLTQTSQDNDHGFYNNKLLEKWRMDY